MKRMKTLTILAALGLIAILLCANPSAAYAACTSPAGDAGEIGYNTDAKFFQYCNGTNWIRMNRPGTGAGGCANPSFAEAKIGYNEDFRVMQGCAGNVWRAMGAIGGEFGWKQISAGGFFSNYSCGIKSDNTLHCWGSNSSGQLGDGTSGTDRLVPTAINGGGTWTQVSAANGQDGQHTCAIKSDDTLHCWGYNFYGQLGDGTSGTDRLVPTAINGGGSWKQVAVGGSHTCAIKSDDTLHCWGRNNSGQLGDGTSGTDRLVPTAINGGGSWKQVAASAFHTCAIKSDESLWCWGQNSHGQLGDNSTTQRLIPTAVSGGGTWKKIAAGSSGAGGEYSCGIKSDDTLYCWGFNPNGELGDGTSGTDRLVPTGISGGGAWKQVSTGVDYTCAIKSDDTSWCWGYNSIGQLGDNTSGTNRLVPTPISGGGSWKQITAGGSHTCAIKSDDTLRCWGNNNNGEIGINSPDEVYVPTVISGGGSWKQVAAGSEHNCGIKSDDTLHCWGRNNSGQLGDNSVTERLVPTAVNGGGSWKQVASGLSHTCAIKSDDTLHCWGYNFYGQLGDGTSGTDRLVPTAINGGGSWKQVAVGGSHTCAIKSDDTLHCWGLNSNGRTGLNTTVGNTLVPTQVTGGGTWKQISGGGGHTCAIKSDDTLHCWGANGNGRTGLNTAAGNTLIPTAINGGGSWTHIAAGSLHTCGSKADDSLWCWGSNGNGRLGDNSTTQRLVPTAISGGGSWTQVTAASDHTCAIKSDDSLWCWGRNDYGKLGDNSNTQRLVPTAISGGGAWTQVAGGTFHTCAVNADDSLQCWGRNQHGQLTATEYSAPYHLTGVQTWCSAPARKEAALGYNSDFNVLQYCDGVGWVRIGK